MSSTLQLHENPEFIDFNDDKRATGMGERYSNLYDNEWTEAFMELTDGHGKSDSEVVQILLDILTVSIQTPYYA